MQTLKSPIRKEPMVCLMIGTHMKEITGDICRLFSWPQRVTMHQMVTETLVAGMEKMEEL